MILGAKLWKDGEYHSQMDNPTEGLLRRLWKKLITWWLETCGPAAALNCLSAVGYDTKITCPGKYKIESDEVLSDCFNDPELKEEFRKIRNYIKVPGGRVPQFYPFAVKLVFNAKAEFVWGKSWDTLVKFLQLGCSVQICKKKPGHYIAIVAYDSETKEAIHKDSWGTQKHLKNKGINERMSKQEFETNNHGFMIVYYPPDKEYYEKNK